MRTARGQKRGGATRLIIAMVVALFAVPSLVRAFVLEAFNIPAGSMIPTILVGDHIFVNKAAYGLRVPLTDRWLTRGEVPARGEIIVFKYPRDPSKDYIKRVVAVGGDVVSVDGDQVFVNGKGLVRSGSEPYELLDDSEDGLPAVRRRFRLSREAAAGATARTYGVIHRDAAEVGSGGKLNVPGSSELPGLECRSPDAGEERGSCKVMPGFVFVLGDNRDNSSDSRVWGGVPVDFVKGRAWVIWYSARAERIGLRID